jgi:hypothetical protein
VALIRPKCDPLILHRQATDHRSLVQSSASA